MIHTWLTLSIYLSNITIPQQHTFCFQFSHLTSSDLIFIAPLRFLSPLTAPPDKIITGGPELPGWQSRLNWVVRWAASGEQRAAPRPLVRRVTGRLALALTNLSNLCLLFLLCSHYWTLLTNTRVTSHLWLVGNANMINDKTLTDALTELIAWQLLLSCNQTSTWSRVSSQYSVWTLLSPPTPRVV